MKCPCKSCVHQNAVKCMQETLKPGYYSDQEWIDAGAPAKCYCPCHKEPSK